MRSLHYDYFPIEPKIDERASPEERAARRAEQAATLREESEDWKMFEWSVAQGSEPDILNADLARGTTGVALRLA